MRNAKQTLALLNLLASSQSVAPAFLHGGVAGKVGRCRLKAPGIELLKLKHDKPHSNIAFKFNLRRRSKAAYAVVHFLEVLLGPRAGATLKVEKPQQYGFDPKQLVLSIVEFTVRLDGSTGGNGSTGGGGGGFAAALAAEDDYDAAVLGKAANLLDKHTFGAADLPPRLRAIVNAVAHIRSGSGVNGGTPDKGKALLDASVLSSPGGGGGSDSISSGATAAMMAALGPEPAAEWEAEYVKVGRCRLTLSNPR